MATRIRHHFSSNAVAYLALFVALGGTGAWAVDKIGSEDIAKNAVLSKHIKAKQVKTGDLADNAVTGAKIACKGNDPADVMVEVGPLCMDRYEVSVWSEPDGGTQFGVGTDDYPCSDTGNDCKDQIYARSVEGVPPSTQITWFQAQQALANSGKRLPTNAEWQMAAAGTPDPGATPGSEDCNTSSGGIETAGERENCVSSWGVNDMVGNVHEWVADWDEEAVVATSWPAGFGSDLSGVGRGEGDPSSRFPGALIRGGSRVDGAAAGVFSISAAIRPEEADGAIGLRGVR